MTQPIDSSRTHVLPLELDRTYPVLVRGQGVWDQVLLAPAYTSSDGELSEMVERFAATIQDVESAIKGSLSKTEDPGTT